MKKHKIKTAKTRLFAICWTAAIILAAVFSAAGCGKDNLPKAPRITITIKGDEHVTGVPAEITVGRRLKWGTRIKELVQRKVNFDKGYELLEWRFNNGTGDVIKDTDTFTKDTTVFAVSRPELPKVKLTVKGDANIKGVPVELRINKDAAWTEVTPQVLAKVSAKEGFEILEWKYDSASGAAVADTDTFGTDKTVFAVSATKVPKYTITIDGDDFVTGKPAKLENIRQGTQWVQVKERAEAKINIHEDYELLHWQLGKNGSILEDSYKIEKDTTVYAKTKESNNPKITLTAFNPEHVEFKSGNSFRVPKGSIWSKVKVKAESKVQCKEGCRITDWKYGNEQKPLTGGYTFNDSETVHVVTEKLPAVTFEVKDGGGTIKAQAEGGEETFSSPVYAEAGKTVTFTATPNENYAIDTWSISEGSFTEGGNKGEATAKIKVKDGLTVKVTFKPFPKVTFKVEGDNGTLKASAPGIADLKSGTSIPFGTAVTFTAKPNKNYRIGTWSISGGTFSTGGNKGNETAKVTVNGNITVKVTFAPPPKVNFRVEGGNGTLKASAPGIADLKSGTSVPFDTVVTFTAEPNQNYGGCTWSISGGTFSTGGNKGDKTAKVKVTEELTVKVTFKPFPKITYSSSGEGYVIAAIKGNSNLSSGTSVPFGTTVTFTAKPADFNEVDSWTISGGSFSTGGKSRDRTAKVTVNQDITVQVKFIKWPTVTFGAEGRHGMLTASSPYHSLLPTNTQVPFGTTVTFTAKPDKHYKTRKWTISSNSSFSSGGNSGDNISTVIINGDTNVYLYFKEANSFSDSAFPAIYINEKRAYNMKWVSGAGTIGQKEQRDNKPHKINLTRYVIGETEVTQSLWKAIMGNNPSNFVSDERPVENVNWYECIAFCNELTKGVLYDSDACVYYTDEGTVYTPSDAANERNPIMNMDKRGFRLPTEAEWEWAAQSKDKREKWSGTDTEAELGNCAWFTDNSDNSTHPVKTKRSNYFGLYDMSGNVREWCWDWYSNNTPPGGTDPISMSSENSRVIRGGSYDGEVWQIKCAFRNGSLPHGKFSDTGLRVVCRIR